jgi:hypothetical protein
VRRSRQPPWNGSTPWLAGGVVVFLLLFQCQRQASGFLRVEAQATSIRGWAEELQLHPASALAVCEQAPQLAPVAQRRRLLEFARLSAELGEPLAVVAMQGPEAARRARDEVARASGDVMAAWQSSRAQPFAVLGLRYELTRARYADRDSGRLRD